MGWIGVRQEQCSLELVDDGSTWIVAECGRKLGDVYDFVKYVQNLLNGVADLTHFPRRYRESWGSVTGTH